MEPLQISCQDFHHQVSIFYVHFMLFMVFNYIILPFYEY